MDYNVSTDGYAPADFPDANDTRPTDTLFDYGISNTYSPVTTCVNNLVSRHMYEMKEKTSGGGATTPSQWKRKINEFVLFKMNDILEFASKPLAKHPVLGPAELLMRKFSRGNFSPSHQSVKEVALDASGIDVVEMINAELVKFEPGTLKGYQETTRYLYDKYKEAGEKIIQNDGILQMRIDLFDKVQKRVAALSELQVNDEFSALAAASETYLARIFEDNRIEECYKNLIESYRVFLLLREILTVRGYIDTLGTEPLCGICFSAPVQYAVSPCGHTFCGTCAKKQMTQCYMCRGQIKDRVKLFFG